MKSSFNDSLPHEWTAEQVALLPQGDLLYWKGWPLTDCVRFNRLVDAELNRRRDQNVALNTHP